MLDRSSVALAFAQVGVGVADDMGDEPPTHTEIPEQADCEPDHEPARQAAAVKAAAAPIIKIGALPPLTPAEWAARDLPAPVLLLGYWLTSTSRALLTADTGLGKTNYGIAVGLHLAAGISFLHWTIGRPYRVLYIDGEMSRRLLRERIAGEVVRIGQAPNTFFALSREDIPKFNPLNTPEGHAWLIAFIQKIGGVDLIIFDNIMSLTVGDMKDPEAWQRTLPLALDLTKAEIGQIWIHHTGKNTTESYGDKSREWQMDTVIHLDAEKRADTDVSFCLTFKKARERTPTTRFDFQDVKIALVNDRWEHELTDVRRPGRVAPRIEKALQALTNVIAGDNAETLPGNRRAAKSNDWKAECVLLGLIDAEAKPHSARTLFATFRRELVAADRIACEGDYSWLL